MTKRLKPLLDAGIELAQLSPVRVEAIVRELVKQGEVRRHEASGLVQLLVERGRDAGEKAAETVRLEVARQLDRLVHQVALVEAQVSEISKRLRVPDEPHSAAATTVARTPAAGGVSRDPEAPVAPAKKAPAKKAPAKKAPAKKAPAKKAPAKKAPAKKVASSKQRATKKAPVNKTGA